MSASLLCKVGLHNYVVYNSTPRDTLLQNYVNQLLESSDGRRLLCSFEASRHNEICAGAQFYLDASHFPTPKSSSGYSNLFIQELYDGAFNPLDMGSMPDISTIRICTRCGHVNSDLEKDRGRIMRFLEKREAVLHKKLKIKKDLELAIAKKVWPA